MTYGTSLKRVDPFQELMGIQDRMNQLFRGSFAGYGDDTLTSGAWAPAVDIYETPEAVEMTFEIPGVNQKDIKVNIENNPPLGGQSGRHRRAQVRARRQARKLSPYRAQLRRLPAQLHRPFDD